MRFDFANCTTLLNIVLLNIIMSTLKLLGHYSPTNNSDNIIHHKAIFFFKEIK